MNCLQFLNDFDDFHRSFAYFLATKHMARLFISELVQILNFCFFYTMKEQTNKYSDSKKFPRPPCIFAPRKPLQLYSFAKISNICFLKSDIDKRMKFRKFWNLINNFYPLVLDFQLLRLFCKYKKKSMRFPFC